MATVGQQLLQADGGWKRYDDRDSNITFSGNWIAANDPGTCNATTYYIQNQASPSDFVCRFNFTGTKLRVISTLRNNMVDNVIINIDGVDYRYSQYNNTTIYQALVFEKTGLQNEEHSVNIKTDKTNGVFDIDAFDIDESGELIPYNPQIPSTPTGNKLLRITLNDSSEREYQVTSTKTDDFIKWCDRTVDTGSAIYTFDKVVGSQKSKEYLLFEKIISFEVFELN